MRKRHVWGGGCRVDVVADNLGCNDEAPGAAASRVVAAYVSEYVPVGATVKLGPTPPGDLLAEAFSPPTCQPNARTLAVEHETPTELG